MWAGWKRKEKKKQTAMGADGREGACDPAEALGEEVGRCRGRGSQK